MLRLQASYSHLNRMPIPNFRGASGLLTWALIAIAMWSFIQHSVEMDHLLEVRDSRTIISIEIQPKNWTFKSINIAENS